MGLSKAKAALVTIALQLQQLWAIDLEQFLAAMGCLKRNRSNVEIP